MGVPATQSGELLDLFAHKLQKNQYRVFAKDKVMVTVFMGKAILRTASTMFHCGSVDPDVRTPSQVLTTNVPTPAMQLSESAVFALQQLSHTDLQKLAGALGHSKSMLNIISTFFYITVGGSSEDLAYVIAGRSKKSQINSITALQSATVPKGKKYYFVPLL